VFSRETPLVRQAIPCCAKSPGEVFSQDLVSVIPTEATFHVRTAQPCPQDEDTNVHLQEDMRAARNSASLRSNHQVVRLWEVHHLLPAPTVIQICLWAVLNGFPYLSA